MSTDAAGRRAASAESAREEATRQLEQELVVLLRRVRSKSVRIARAVHPQLDVTAYGLLLRVALGEAATVTELAVALGVGKPTVSRQVAALAGLGLLRREPEPEDGRAFRLHLTEEGDRRLSAARAARQREFRSLLDAWPVEDLRLMAEQLERFNSAMG